MLKSEYRTLLIQTAREAIYEEFTSKHARRMHMSGQSQKACREACRIPLLNEERGVFVTLKTPDAAGRLQLRGCIGTIVGREPLCQGVRRYAKEAAFHDPRFYPLSEEEFDEIEIEISVLTPLRTVASYNDIVLGQDGIVLRNGFRSAVFLPQVAPEQGWTLEETLSHLSMKAGLPMVAWKDPETEFSVFQAEVFGEQDAEAAGEEDS